MTATATLNVILKAVIVELILIGVVSCAGIDLHNYDKMPPVHLHDNYLDCLKDFGKAAVYCSAKTYVKPNENSSVWKIIQDYSADSHHHYRHDSLVRGFCANRCEKLLQEHEAPYLPEFIGDTTIYFSKLKYSQRKEDQLKYGELINRCANIDLQKYGLEAYSEIDYCTTTDPEPYDWLDWACLWLLLGIGAWTCVSTVYDLYLKPEGEHSDYFLKYPLNSSRMLLAFSVPRNYTSLVTITKRSTNANNNNNNGANNNTESILTDDFAWFEAIRMLTMIVNIHVHLWSTMASLPSANGEDFEKETYNVGFKIACGATFTNQIYLFFGGFLLTRSAVKEIKRGKIMSFRDLYDDLKKRYWRLTPLYAFAILMEATWIRHMYSGPFWQNYWMEDYGNCRQNWWANLLYVHNFVDPQYQCILPTWYLSTDMQLYLVRFLILYVISRIPNKKVQILSIVGAVAYLIPGFVAYIYDLDPVYRGTMEGARFFYRHDVQFATHHVPSHTNFGSYFSGMIIAFVYHEIQERKIDIRQSRFFNLSWYIHYPLFFGLLSSSWILCTYDFTRPSIGMAIAAILHKNLWSVLLASTLLAYCARMGGHVKSFLDCSLWQVFGRTNYGFYLSHMTMFKFLIGNFHQPYYYSFSNLVFMVLNIVAFSYVVGSILHVLIELPAANLQKIWNTRQATAAKKMVVEKRD